MTGGESKLGKTSSNSSWDRISSSSSTSVVNLLSCELLFCLQAECDSVVGLSADRDAAEENTYCEVPGPGEQLSDTLKRLCRGMGSFFVLGLDVCFRVPHIKPDIAPHPISVGRPGV